MITITEPNKKTFVFNVWNDSDPTDSFNIQADTTEEALSKALSYIGWTMGEGESVTHEELEEHDIAN